MKPSASAWPTLALAAVAAAATAGCGSSSHHGDRATAGDGTAFLSSVDAVCAKAVAAHKDHAFPVPDFDPESPDPSELPTVGDYFAAYGGLPTTTAALHALHPPSGDTAAWQRLLADADQIVANSQRQIEAARRRDTAAFVTTVHTANGLIDQINAAAGRLGISSDSPCHQVFG